MDINNRSYLVDQILHKNTSETETGDKLTSGETEGDNIPVDMQEAVSTINILNVGDIATGKVAKIQNDGILIDLGIKSEGFVPETEWIGDFSLAKLGIDVQVYVMTDEDDEDSPLQLSQKKAFYEQQWNNLQVAKESGITIEGIILEKIRGGLKIDLGVEGFIPASQVYMQRQDKIENFIGKTLQVKVLEINRERNQVLCSHRIAFNEYLLKLRNEALSRIKTGSVIEGKVSRIADFGAFVDLGGIDGLLHVSEMAWHRVDHPSSVVSEGQTITVIVLNFDQEKERISLGLRQLLSDPWVTAEEMVPVGSTVTVKINSIIPNLAFVQLEQGLEAVIPISEISDDRINSISDVLKKGEEVQAKVIHLDVKQRRMTLSIRQVVQESERKEIHNYISGQEKLDTTIGDTHGDILDQAFANALKRKQEPEKKDA